MPLTFGFLYIKVVEYVCIYRCRVVLLLLLRAVKG